MSWDAKITITHSNREFPFTVSGTNKSDMLLRIKLLVEILIEGEAREERWKKADKILQELEASIKQDPISFTKPPNDKVN